MFSYPNLKVSRMNLSSIASDRLFKTFRPDVFLRQVQAQMIKSIRANIMQEAFSPAAKKRLKRGFEVTVGPRSITILAKDPAFRPLIEGQRAGQMFWLVKAQAPIPIVLDSGELIFRSATPQSMANGSWRHPGRTPTTVIERAKDVVRSEMKEHAKKLLRQQLRSLSRSQR